ncbi:MAG: acetate--CoA ligase family protein [Syntrophobacteraceae bacterium]
MIEKALAEGRSTLSEHESKQLLSSFGIPVTNEVIARDAAEAASSAASIGFPVVLKASGASLSHKTEVGGVALNLHTEAEVRKEGERLLKIPGCEALLVQEMVKGGREIVCGLIRDPQFGPCVMFGIGGILTEVLEDIAFRIAPLTLSVARDMVAEIRGKKIVEPFRAEEAADVDQLCQTLVALGEIGIKYRDVLEIDINPLKIRPNGKAVAVDALVVLKAGGRTACQEGRLPSAAPEGAGGRTACREGRLPSTAPEGMGSASRGKLGPFFEPASVAIIGASATPHKAGNDVIKNILANGYPGKLFPVNPRGGEILGIPVHTSISGLPEGIDLAVIILPAKDTPGALRECAAKGIRQVVLSAGGFSEVDESGAGIEQDLIDIVRQTGVRVLGPNTSGHTSTPHRFTSTFFPLGKIRPGKVSYVAQTGNFATHTMKHILTAEHFGVSRVIGLGNKIDIDESDALEYLAEDPHTSAIIMYLESIKRPGRFLEIAGEVTRLKPVIVLKSGATEAGRRAAVAHTAAMAAEDRLVDGLLRQAGIVRIWNYTHLILAAKALSMSPLPKGKRISFLAPSGAMLVTLADLCVRLGLEIPDLTPQARGRLQEISPPFIRMRNPVDIWAAASVSGVEFGYREGMEAVLKDPNIDAVVAVLMLTQDTGIPPFDFIVDLAKRYPEKPVFITFSGDKHFEDECKATIEPLGVPSFAYIEQPFEVLSILSRCVEAMRR